MWHDITLPCTYVSLTIRSFNNTYVNTYLDDIRHETKMMSLVACAYCTTCIRVRRTRAFGYLRSHTQWPHMRPIDLEVDEAVAPFGDLGTRTNGVLPHTNGVLSQVCLYSLSCRTCVPLFQTRVCMRMFISQQNVCVCVCLSDALRPCASTSCTCGSTSCTCRSMLAPAHMSYGLPTTSTLLKIVCIFCERAL